MGTVTSLSADSSSQDVTSSKQTKQCSDERRKKFSKFNTLKKKLIRSRSSYKCQDHGKLLREVMQTWSTQDISALVEEYESLAALKETSLETNLARPQVSSLKKDLANLFENSYCSDVTLLYDGIQFPVHRAVLSARCSYFRDLLSHCDGKHPVVKIDIKTEEISANMFSTLLYYLYTGEILCSQAGQDNLDILIKLGDEFGTPNVLEQDFKSLLSSAEFADTVLVYPGENHPDIAVDSDIITNHTYELPCHRAILCARSPYFRSLFLGKNSVLLSDNGCGVTRLVLEESIVPRQYARILLQCLYTDSVDLSFIVKWGSENRKDSFSETHKLLTTAEIAMEVYEVASFTDFDILAQGCEDIIAEELSMSTLLQTLEWSSQPHGSNWVHKQAVQFMEAEFIHMVQSDIFPFLPKNYLVKLLTSDFLQACEYDVLMAVIKWGEVQVLKQMGQQDQFQEGKKSTKRPRELDNEAVRQELSGVIEHVRIGHLLPAHGELLDNVMRRGLVERCVPLDIGEGSYFPHSPWMRNQGEKGFVRPRLFMPYYEESKVILQEHMAAEMERVRQRMVRMCQTMPDTLYMVSNSSSPKQRKLRRASSQSFPVGGSSVSVAELDLSTVRERTNEPSVCSQTHRTQAGILSDKRVSGGSKRTVRELGLPDVAMEVAGLYCTAEDNADGHHVASPRRGARPYSVHIDFRPEHDEHFPSSVPDVTIPSSPTVSLDSRSDSLPDYFRYDPHRLDLIEDEAPGSSS